MRSNGTMSPVEKGKLTKKIHAAWENLAAEHKAAIEAWISASPYAATELYPAKADTRTEAMAAAMRAALVAEEEERSKLGITRQQYDDWGMYEAHVAAIAEEWSRKAELMRGSAQEIFRQNDSEVTKGWYDEMNKRGVEGQLAVALFRAQKSWDNVEKWPVSRFSEQKNNHRRWSLSEVCRILSEHPDLCPWGWGKEDHLATPAWPHVLHLELPRCGSLTFFCEVRLQGPDHQRFYPYTTAELERSFTRDRILDYCDRIQGLL